MSNLNDTLHKLRKEFDEISDEEKELKSRTDQVSNRIGQFLEQVADQRIELQEELAEEIIELENDLRDRYPGLVENIRAAVRILTNAGI